MIRKFAALSWMTILVAACSNMPSPPQPAVLKQSSFQEDSQQQSSLRDTLQGLATRHGICAVTAAIIKNREAQPVDAVQGCATDSKLTSESVFEAASLSKPVFAYAVLKLVQAGKLELDAPVSKYLPEGYEHQFHPYLPKSPTDLVPNHRLQSITVRMVLNHTSGLPNWAGGPLVFNSLPGEKWEYSGEGYALLQRAVETVTHQKLDEFMEQQVFKPLGMTHSAFTREPRLEKHIIPGSNRDGASIKPWPFVVPVAAFTLYTSARDYSLFLAALLNDERSLQQIVGSPVDVNPKLNLSWGLGWGLEYKDDDIFIWHWGNNPGYRAFAIASTRTGNGFVMFTNNDNGLVLAEPAGEKILGKTHKVFRFHLLREGIANWLCKTLDVCL